MARRYRIVRTLGSGGMASVYLADDEVLGETRVALKVLKHSGQSTVGAAERFLREVRLTYRIHHENVVRTFDLGQDGDMRFYTMEYLQGQTLSSIISDDGISISAFTRIAAQISRGLSAIHSVGVIHRDLKPDNIMLVDDMRVKITDFGIARGDVSKLTGSADQIVGTIAYLAPELLTGEQVTIAADYYSLGAVLYELLTGRHPIAEDVPARLIMRKINEKPLDPRTYRSDIPDWIADGVMALLNPNPAVRSYDARAFVYRLAGSGPADPGSAFVAPPRDVPLTDEPTAVFERRLLQKLIVPSAFGRVGLIQTALLTVLALLASPLLFTNTASKIELSHLDNLFRFRGALVASPDVVTVALDEASYFELKVPMAGAWPRALHARLLDKLKLMGARRVVFDVLFVNGESDQLADQQLAQSMRSIPTVLGAAIGTVQQATLNGAYTVEQMIRPDPVLESAAAGIGMVTLAETAGRVRSFYRHHSEVFKPLPSLAVIGSGVSSERDMPGERAMINFYGPSGNQRRFSYGDILSEENRVPAEAFKDKIVVVGLSLRSRSGPAQRDTFSSPFDSEMFGTDIHATAISNILEKDWINRLPPLVELTCSLLVGVLLGIVVLFTTGPLLPFGLLAVCIVCGVCQYGLFLYGYFAPIICGGVIGLFCGSMLRWGMRSVWQFHDGRRA